MPRHAGQTAALAVNTDSPNVLAGKLYEFIPRTWRKGAAVRVLAATTAAAGIGSQAKFKIDSQVVLDAENVSAAGRSPVIPDDQLCVHWAPSGARLFLIFNGGPAGATINWAIDIEPA